MKVYSVLKQSRDCGRISSTVKVYRTLEDAQTAMCCNFAHGKLELKNQIYEKENIETSVEK